MFGDWPAYLPSTWILTIGCILCCIGPPRASAQQWTGSAGIDVSAGYQTNPYLDPTLGAWDPGADPVFAGVTPQAGLRWTHATTSAGAVVRARMLPRDDVPQYVQGSLYARHALADRWTVGVLVGGSRYRLQSARDTGWLLPDVQWELSSQTSITLRAGLTRRVDRSFSPTDRQTSALVTLSASTWLTDRLRGTARLYRTDGRTSAAATDFGGTGLSLQGTYWPTHALAVDGRVAVEQLGYDVGSTGPSRDRIGRVGVEVRWLVRNKTTLFARTHALVADLAQQSSLDADVHVSAGVRLYWTRALGASTDEPQRPHRSLWSSTRTGVRFHVPYDGDGQPHLTGDFNGWALPGIPLTETESGVWSVSLPLSPGRYEYRIRIVDGSDDARGRWFDLPAYAQTARDAFGGTNGVCIVE